MSDAENVTISRGQVAHKSIEGEALKVLARSIPEGEVMTWDAMLAATNQGKAKTTQVWTRVRRSLVAEGIVFGRGFELGYKRLPPDETVGRVDDRVETIRKTAHTAAQENRTVDRRRLAPELAAHADTQAIVLSVIAEKSTQAKVKLSEPQPVTLTALSGGIEMK